MRSTTSNAYSKILTLFLVLGITSALGCAKPATLDDSVSEKNRTELVTNTVDESDGFDGMTDEEADAWLASKVADGKVLLEIGNTQIRVEYADTQEKRQLGLMYRRELCTNCGMLFKFDYPRIGSIWMKNTYIPLDLAYIDQHGKIIDIKQLKAHNLTPVESSSNVLYALEMNLGWFAKQDIRVGDMVSLLP